MAERATPYLLTPTYSVSAAERRQANLFATRTQSMALRPIAERRMNGLCVDGTLGAEDAVFWLAETSLRSVVPDAAAVPNLRDLPPPLLSALAHLALEPVLKSIRNELGQDVQITGAAFKDLPPGMAIEIPLGAASAQRTILRPSEDVLAQVCAVLTARPLVLRGENSQNASVTVLFEAGRLEVSLNDLGGLRAGDALLLDRHPSPDTVGLSLLGQDDPLGFADLGDTQIEVRQWRIDMMTDLEPNDEDDDLDDDEADAPEDAYAVPIHDVSVNLRFVLASQDITVAELGSIGEGYIFDLERPLESLVTIYAGKKQLGTGELVLVGDRAAIRLSRLNAEEDG